MAVCRVVTMERGLWALHSFFCNGKIVFMFIRLVDKNQYSCGGGKVNMFIYTNKTGHRLIILEKINRLIRLIGSSRWIVSAEA